MISATVNRVLLRAVMLIVMIISSLSDPSYVLDWDRNFIIVARSYRPQHRPSDYPVVTGGDADHRCTSVYSYASLAWCLDMEKSTAPPPPVLPAPSPVGALPSPRILLAS